MTTRMFLDMEKVAEYLHEKELRDSSIRTIAQQIKRVLINVLKTPMPRVNQIKNKLDDIMIWIDTNEKMKNYNTKKSHLNAINHLLLAYKIDNEPILEKLKEYTELTTAEQALNNPTDKKAELINNVDFDELTERMRAEKSTKNKLILAFYTLLPPLRQQDIINLKVFEKITRLVKLPSNYIDLSKKQLIISNHKTSKSNGSKTIQLGDELVSIIRKYMSLYNTDTLLPTTSSNFTKYFQRNFNGLSPQILRKAFVSKYADGLTLEERYALSKTMGHKISTSQLIYNKPKLVENKKTKPQDKVKDDDDDYDVLSVLKVN